MSNSCSLYSMTNSPPSLSVNFQLFSSNSHFLSSSFSFFLLLSPFLSYFCISLLYRQKTLANFFFSSTYTSQLTSNRCNISIISRINFIRIAMHSTCIQFIQKHHINGIATNWYWCTFALANSVCVEFVHVYVSALAELD